MTIIACDCSIDLGLFDRAVRFESFIRRARKPYACGECGDVIEVGERYEYVRGLWDGHYDTHRTCLPCTRIRDWYCPSAFVYGEVREQISECLGFDYTKAWEDDGE